MWKKRLVVAVRDVPAVVARTLRFGAVTAYEPLLLYRHGSARTVALSSPTGPRRSRDRQLRSSAASAVAPRRFVLPPDEPEGERDKLCGDCTMLPAPPA
jgi:hypothetical protein